MGDIQRRTDSTAELLVLKKQYLWKTLTLLEDENMKRRDFLKKTSAVTGGVALSGVPMIRAFAQSTNPTKGGVLRWGHSETSQNIDMHQTGTASTHRTMNNIMESLYWPD